MGRLPKVLLEAQIWWRRRIWWKCLADPELHSRARHHVDANVRPGHSRVGLVGRSLTSHMVGSGNGLGNGRSYGASSSENGRFGANVANVGAISTNSGRI